MVAIVAPDPDTWRKAHSNVRSLKTNIVQMRKAFKAWKTAKSNAQLEPLLIELVESVDSLYAMMKQKYPNDFQ